MLNIITNDILLIKKKRQYYKVNINKIIYIEKIKNTKNVRIVIYNGDKIITRCNIKDCLTIFKNYNFSMLNKSFIINLNQIKEFNSEFTPYIKFNNNVIIYTTLGCLRKQKVELNKYIA